MGVFYNHRCKTCGVKYPNHQIRRSRGGWECVTCARQAGLERKARKGLRGLPRRK